MNRDEEEVIIGVDEAGRGACIGPLVIAAVKISKDKLSKLCKLGIKDSKLLTREKRQSLYQKIIDIVDDYRISPISPEELNNALITQLEIEKIKELCENLAPYDTLIIDKIGGLSKEKFIQRLKFPCKRLIYEKKADTKYKPVQAAAILAKVTRDKAIKDLGYSNISGYPNATTNKFIIEYFLHNKTLPKGTRLRWKNIKQLID